MTPVVLVDGLVEFIKGVVKDYELSTRIDGISKVPSVHAGYLPADVDEDENLAPSDYPFVIVRFLSAADENDSDTANIRLVIGTHSEDEQNGWRDALNIATRVKIALKKSQFIGPFALAGRIQTELFEEQLRPFWHVIMDLSFNTPQVQPEWRNILE